MVLRKVPTLLAIHETVTDFVFSVTWNSFVIKIDIGYSYKSATDLVLSYLQNRTAALATSWPLNWLLYRDEPECHQNEMYVFTTC